MIMLCERCFAPIDGGSRWCGSRTSTPRTADGSISWVHSYLHTDGCAAPRPAPHERPDTGAWNPARGIGSRRP